MPSHSSRNRRSTYCPSFVCAWLYADQSRATVLRFTVTVSVTLPSAATSEPHAMK